jgi:hypothetical protein
VDSLVHATAIASHHFCHRYYIWICIEKWYRMYIHISQFSNYQIRIVQSPNRHYSWICIEKQCRMYIYIFVDSQYNPNRLIQLLNEHHSWICIKKTGPRHIQLFNHQKDLIIEFVLKNGTECVYIFANSQNYLNRLVQLPNRCYGEKCVLNTYNTSNCNKSYHKSF